MDFDDGGVIVQEVSKSSLGGEGKGETSLGPYLDAIMVDVGHQKVMDLRLVVMVS